jgi:hypothetical protein
MEGHGTLAKACVTPLGKNWRMMQARHRIRRSCGGKQESPDRRHQPHVFLIADKPKEGVCQEINPDKPPLSVCQQ